MSTESDVKLLIDSMLEDQNFEMLQPQYAGHPEMVTHDNLEGKAICAEFVIDGLLLRLLEALGRR